MNQYDGLLLIDKPLGLSSNQCVQQVRRTLNIRKAGHTGTLDPLATGLLPICCGKATRLANFLLFGDKSYQATIALGVRTDTGDSEGDPVETTDIPLITQTQLDDLAQSLIGPHNQLPPLYSAIKVAGRPMYAWAREHKQYPDRPVPTLETRKINLYQLSLKLIDSSHISMQVDCSKGTYVRSLAEDVAERLNTLGHLCQLRRTGCGTIAVTQAIELSRLQESTTDIAAHWLSMEEIVSDLPQLHISAEEAKKITDGIPLKLPNENLHGTISLLFEARLIALATADPNDNTLTPVKVFCR